MTIRRKGTDGVLIVRLPCANAAAAKSTRDATVVLMMRAGRCGEETKW